MANRIIFLPNSKVSSKLYLEELVTFEWIPGKAISQEKKSIKSMHDAAIKQLRLKKILEISTKSEEILGISLSAFNLNFENNNFSVESVYQSSKIFENGGPYQDLLQVNSLKAKTDSRLKNSGKLIGFRFEGEDFPVTRSPNFYDYIYLRGLLSFAGRNLLMTFDAFTDIAFSQTSLTYKNKRTYNCQARSAAIFCSLTTLYTEAEIIDKIRELLGNHQVESSQLDLF